MKPSFDFFAVVNCVGIAQAVFWAWALLSLKKGNVRANRILASLLFLLALGIALATLYQTNYILAIPHLAEVAAPLGFLYPPVFYLYVKAMTSDRLSFRKQAFHFVPFVMCVVYLVPFYLQNAESKNVYLLAPPTDLPSSSAIISLLILLQELIYIVLTLTLVAKHSTKIKHSFSSIEKVNLAWIRNIVLGFILVSVIYVFLETYESPVKSIYLVPFSLTIMIYVLGYKGLKQPSVFYEEQNSVLAKKYRKSGLGTEQAEKYREKLLRFVETEQPFTKNDLTLRQLAGDLSISPNHLSQLLNEKLNQSFFDFINKYRIEEAKKRLLDPRKTHLTILAIAYDVGFSSKSVFNSAFKKHTQMTPIEFRKASQREYSDPARAD